MIKIFRKIRQNLLSEGKTGKYLKYAFGEIVLVVIGILIALQVNDWNNQRIERQLEDDILKEIVSNLDFDLENIETKIEENRMYSKHNQIVYDHLKNKTPLTDSLKYYYSYLYGYGNFLPMTVAYENLKSRGLSIIKNKNLRKDISKLYDFDFKAGTSQIQQAIFHMQARHSSEINENLTTEISYKSAQPNNLIALQNDIQFQETLKTIVFARQWTNSIFEQVKENISKLKISIEEELYVHNK